MGYLVKLCIPASTVQSNLDISNLMGLFVTSSNYPKCKLICTSGLLDLLNSPQRQILVRESNQNVFLIQIDTSTLLEFELSEFEISRFDCIVNVWEKCKCICTLSRSLYRWLVNEALCNTPCCINNVSLYNPFSHLSGSRLSLWTNSIVNLYMGSVYRAFT